MNIHYALQTCDIASNQVEKRLYADTKEEITKKCVTSFFKSVHEAAKKERSIHHTIRIFDDRSSERTVTFLKNCVLLYSYANVTVEFEALSNPGIMNSISACYDWLIDNGTNLLYQVQDDYLFELDAVTEMIDIFFRIMKETNSHSVVTPYNAPYLWRDTYRNRTTPRTIFLGEKRYWIQIYDVSCSFMTSRENFINNRDLLNKFLSLDSKHHELEKISLNRMFVERGLLGVCPFESIALHMQGEYEYDPYVDWKRLWKEN